MFSRETRGNLADSAINVFFALGVRLSLSLPGFLMLRLGFNPCKCISFPMCICILNCGRQWYGRNGATKTAITLRVRFGCWFSFLFLLFLSVVICWSVSFCSARINPFGTAYDLYVAIKWVWWNIGPIAHTSGAFFEFAEAQEHSCISRLSCWRFLYARIYFLL